VNAFDDLGPTLVRWEVGCNNASSIEPGRAKFQLSGRQQAHLSSSMLIEAMVSSSSPSDESFMPMREAMKALGVSGQTVLQRINRGELDAVHVMRGKQKGLRIKAIARQPELFDRTS